MLTPFCSYRKRASPLPKDDHSSGVKDCLLANSSDPVEMRRLNYQTPGNKPYVLYTHYQSARAPCVLHHMHAYTFPVTQLWLSVCDIWAYHHMHNAQRQIQPLPYKHNACMMHIIHCTISSVSCSVTLILFFSLHKHASAYAMNEAQYFVLLFIIWLLWIQLFIAVPPFTVSSPWSVLYGLNSPKDLLHSFNPSLLISLPAFHSQGEWEADLWR